MIVIPWDNKCVIFRNKTRCGLDLDSWIASLGGKFVLLNEEDWVVEFEEDTDALAFKLKAGL